MREGDSHSKSGADARRGQSRSHAPSPSVALAIPPFGEIRTESVEVLLINTAGAQEPVGNHRVAQIPPPCELANAFLLLGNVLVQVDLDLFEFPRRQQPLRGNLIAEFLGTCPRISPTDAGLPE